MITKTTINIRESLLKRVEASARELKTSRSKVIERLLIRMSGDRSMRFHGLSRVRYQKPDKDASWKRFHVSLNHDVYEKGLDMRRVYKYSVSFIIEKAVRKYLRKVEKDIKEKKKGDNYMPVYIIIQKYYQNIPAFHIYWGIPDHKTLNRHL